MNLSPAVGLAILLWAGICAADQRALGGRQLHQPIVAAAVVGLLLHAPERALLVGIWLQLIWVAPMPIGGVILPDTGSAAVAAALVAAVIPGWPGFGIAIIVALLIGAVSIPWERSLRDANARRESEALDSEADLDPVERGPRTEHRAPDPAAARHGATLGQAVLWGIAGPFARGALCAGGAIALCFVLRPVLTGAGLAAAPAPAAAAIERALMGGAACFGLAGLFLGLGPGKGRVGAAWVLGGVLLGLAGGLLLRGRIG